MKLNPTSVGARTEDWEAGCDVCLDAETRKQLIDYVVKLAAARNRAENNAQIERDKYQRYGGGR